MYHTESLETDLPTKNVKVKQPDSLREENDLKKDSKMLSYSQSYVPEPVKHDHMVCSKLKYVMDSYN